MPLHTPTLFVVMIIVSLVLAVAIAYIGHGKHPERFLWATGLGLQAVAYILFALRGQIPDLLSVVVSNVALSSSFALYTMGVLRFRQHDWPLWWTWAPVVAVLGVFWALLSHMGPRLIAGASLVTLQTLLLMAAVMHRRDAPLSRGETMLVWGALAITSLMLMRIWAVTTGHLRIQFVTDGGWIQGLTFIAAVTATLLLAIGLIIMSEERAERTLQRSERHYRLLIETAGEGIAVFQAGLLRFANPRFYHLCGLNPGQHANQRFTELVHEDDRELLGRHLDGASDTPTRAPQQPIRLRTLHRGTRWFELNTVPFEWQGRAATLAFLNDITERHETEAAMQRQAFHDGLTQLPNRRLLVNNLELALARHKRNGLLGALMFLDLDNFKPLNDRHGHDIGDLLLIEVAQRLRRNVRENDTVARFGGDEFVVLLSDLSADADQSARQAQAVAQKLLHTLAEPYTLTQRTDPAHEKSVTHHCTASIGLVLFNGGAFDAETLIRQADQAMYRAKEAGRNAVHYAATESSALPPPASTQATPA